MPALPSIISNFEGMRVYNRTQQAEYPARTKGTLRVITYYNVTSPGTYTTLDGKENPNYSYLAWAPKGQEPIIGEGDVVTNPQEALVWIPDNVQETQHVEIQLHNNFDLPPEFDYLKIG